MTLNSQYFESTQHYPGAVGLLRLMVAELSRVEHLRLSLGPVKPKAPPADDLAADTAMGHNGGTVIVSLYSQPPAITKKVWHGLPYCLCEAYWPLRGLQVIN